MMRDLPASLPRSRSLEADWPGALRWRRVPVTAGLYSLPAGVIALIAVSSPQSAPEWLGVSFLAFGALGLMAALWGATALAFTLRAYHAERISFDAVARSMALAARALFRSGQLAAIAGTLGLAAMLALAFPGLAILAALMTPSLALALAASPGAVRVPRYADAALALVVPSQSLPHGSDAAESFRIGWQFEARMAAVRVATADRGTPLPEEARDIAKAVDGGGRIRPPIARLHFDLLGALWLRFRGLEAILVAALPVALLVWIVAALLPPGALPSLPRPGELWPITEALDPASTEAEAEYAGRHSDPLSDFGPDGASEEESASGPTEGEASGSDWDSAEPGPDGGEGDGEGSAHNGAADATKDDGAAGTAARQGEDGPGSEGRANSGQPANAGEPDTEEGAHGSGEGESGQEGDPANIGEVEASSDGHPIGDPVSGDTVESDAESGELSEGGSGSGNEADGGPGQADGSDTGEGDLVTSMGNGLGDDTGPAGHEDGQPEPEGPAPGEEHGETTDPSGGVDGSGTTSRDGGELSSGTEAQQGGEVAENVPDGGPQLGYQVVEVAPSGAAPADGPTEEISLPSLGPADDKEDTGPVPDAGWGAQDAGRAPFSLEPEGGEILPVSTLRMLFAESGTAPPAIIQDLSPEALSDLPPSPALPPRQRLPAWIADLLQ